jgi:zinc transporter ZupT
VPRKGSDDTTVNIVQRRKKTSVEDGKVETTDNNSYENDGIQADWKKIFLLIVAITVHNIPGSV